MTRWAEAKATSRITKEEVVSFVYEHICCRFGVPLEIISDRGPGFRADLLDGLMEKLEIKHRHSTPYYPQCNGLVEKVNGMICKIITKQAYMKPKLWDKHLGVALWDYRTSFKTSLGFTPFHLVYGQEALLPIQLELASLKMVVHIEEGGKKERLQQRIIDLERLDLDRDEAIKHYAKQAEIRREKFNKGLPDKEIGEGSLVLRYANKYDTRHDAKFVPKWEGPYVVVEKFTNGSYQLRDIAGTLHKTRVNGWRLKHYHPRVIWDTQPRDESGKLKCLEEGDPHPLTQDCKQLE